MKLNFLLIVIFVVAVAGACAGQTNERAEAEYLAAAYAYHFHVPLNFLRALIQQESGWQRCPISSKGAAGIMQIMPATARELGVRDLCDQNQNISAGVRHIARLTALFHGDLRLVAAAYCAGERRIQARGLSYANPDVITYVTSIRRAAESQSPVGERRPSTTLTQHLRRTR